MARVTDAQVRKLWAEMSKSGEVGVAAVRAGMSRNTATKYLRGNELPSQLRQPRTWRTRKDRFEEVWPEVAARLEVEPELQAKTLLEDLMGRHPGRYEAGQLRTLQRRVRGWLAEHGPEKELFLPQEHRPGEAMQTDFTAMASLGITIAGTPYAHLLCHAALPYSDWSWAVPCRSESMAALRAGVQAALLRLGHVPEWHQTDNSTAATHRLDTGKREFNKEYLELMDHFGLKPRTIRVGHKEQNGDIESLNGSLKRHVDQQLMLRGSRDFESQEGYVAWLHGILEGRNRTRGARLEQELAAMRPLTTDPLPEYTEVTAPVHSGGTIRVAKATYSVPSRLRGEVVRVRVYDDRLEVYAGRLQLTVERLHGKKRHHINYRHVVGPLLRKPGAFRRYRYREDLLPTETFRLAFEALDAALPQREADIEYLRILELAARTMECDVEDALRRLLGSGVLPSADSVRKAVEPAAAEVPILAAQVIDLSSYDALLEEPLEVPA